MRTLAVASGIALVYSYSAQAQMTDSALANSYALASQNTSAILYANSFRNTMRQRFYNGRQRGSTSVRDTGTSSRSAADTVTGSEPASLGYTPTAALQRVAERGMISRLSHVDPEAARAAAQQMAAHDFGQVYKGLVAPFGLRVDNAADALSAYTILGYLIATGDADPARADVAAVRAQVAAKLAASPQLSAPQTRAELGEELKLLFVTLHAGWQSARREGKLQQYSDGVAAMFLKQGTDLRALRLTDRGFVGR